MELGSIHFNDNVFIYNFLVFWATWDTGGAQVLILGPSSEMAPGWLGEMYGRPEIEQAYVLGQPHVSRTTYHCVTTLAFYMYFS